MMEMSRIAKALGLTKETTDLAFKIFRKAKRRGIGRGESVFALVGASAYVACRTSGDPRELSLIAVQLGIPMKAVERMNGILSESIGGMVTIPDPVRIVERIGMVKKIPENVVESAKKVVVSARQRGLSVGKDPRGLAGAALYICSILAGYSLTERDLATAARVTEVTIRNRCKELAKVLGLELPSSD
jgi:transcription initiation factor TFIIB